MNELKIKLLLSMNSKLILISIFIILLSSFSVTAQTKTVEVKADKSTLSWNGYKIAGGHTGNIKLKSGSLTFDGYVLTSGKFVLDMTSISVTDIKGANAEKLLTHLKSDDFFSIDKYEEATLVIHTASPVNEYQYVLIGDLTIKGITKPIKFEAFVKEQSAGASIRVDRTDYNIKYGSASFFDNLGDKAIKNYFDLEVELVY